MPDFFLPGAAQAGVPQAGLVVARLVAALVLGFVVARVYQRARSEAPSSFTATLVLLSVLIAMVTQVIGDNVARAFSLVGALSIVRFRTVVRDTQDTAYVIFAVAVGMAVGASSLFVAAAGVATVSAAAWLVRRESATSGALPFVLQARVALGQEALALLGPTLDQFASSRRLVEVATARQGMATEVSFRLALRQDDAGHQLVMALNRVDGVQGVSLRRLDDQD
jgi:hypothetical protein